MTPFELRIKINNIFDKHEVMRKELAEDVRSIDRGIYALLDAALQSKVVDLFKDYLIGGKEN